MRETHERNVLVWLVSGEVTYQDCLRVLVVPLYLALFLLLSGCLPSAGPTAPEEDLTPNQLLAIEYKDCHLRYWGKTYVVEVHFAEHIRKDGAKAWADTIGRIIHIAKPALATWTPENIEMAVGHELAHIMGAWDQDLATVWASQAYHNAGCH